MEETGLTFRDITEIGLCLVMIITVIGLNIVPYIRNRDGNGIETKLSNKSKDLRRYDRVIS